MTPQAEEHFRGVLAATPRNEAFGNGRFARNALEEAIGRQAWRLHTATDLSAEQLRELRVEDFQTPNGPQDAPVTEVDFGATADDDGMPPAPDEGAPQP